MNGGSSAGSASSSRNLYRRKQRGNDRSGSSNNSVGSRSVLTGDSTYHDGGRGGGARHPSPLPKGLYGQIDEESDDDDGGRR